MIKIISQETDCLQVELQIEGYSNRLVSELCDSAQGVTRVRTSARNSDCSEFDYYIPNAIENEEEALEEYENCMQRIKMTYASLQKMGIRHEDIANILPLGILTKTVLKMNAQAVQEMAEIGLCARASKDTRSFMNELLSLLDTMDEQWSGVVSLAQPKCEVYGQCDEKRPCKAKYRKSRESEHA